MGIPARAIVRAPGRTYAQALTRQTPVPVVDLALARAQYSQYVATLRRLGLEVIELPADDEHPDAVFVQDRACVVEGRAIVGRSAVAARCGEEAPIVDVLKRSFPVETLSAPACLDWGDVLVAERSLFVGLSERSNEEAVDQLRRLLPDWRVESVTLPPDLLHLLSGCVFLGGGVLLVVDSLADFARSRGFRVLSVAAAEAPAANALAVGDDVIVPAGYPVTAVRISETGRRVHSVAVSEFEKRDGGVTCLSILY